MSRISKVVISGTPAQSVVHGEQQLNLVNVGPPGPAGPPGAGARIDGVVDTVGDLPVAADPGSIWIVRPDMMHVWDEVDGWQAVGPVSVVTGPKINDLPTRPGGPQPTDEFWLASAGGADFKANFNALLQFIASNTSTIALPVISWTPTLIGVGGNPTVTYASQTGQLIRIAKNLAYVRVRVGWTATSGGSGGLRVSTAPGITHVQYSQLSWWFRGITWSAGRIPGVITNLNDFGLLTYQSGRNEALVQVSDLEAAGTISFSGIIQLSS